MRVLVIYDDAEPFGGESVYLRIIDRLLESDGASVDRITGERPFQFRFLNTFDSVLSYAHRKRIGRAIETYDPDVVFILGVTEVVTPSFLLPPPDVPVVLKISNVYQFDHGSEVSPPKNTVIDRIRTAVHNELIERGVDRFVAPSHAALKYARERFDTADVTVVRNPAPWSVREPGDVEPQRHDRMLYVGRPDPAKGIETLVEAFDEFRRTDEETTLDLLGVERSALNERIEAGGLEGRMNPRGYVEHARLKATYDAADVTILPSTIEENCPLAILESMSRGTPVITTNIGGQQELITDGRTGYVVAPGEPRELARAMTKILEDDQRRYEMSMNCLEEAEKYSKERHLEQIRSVFETVSER